MLKSYTNRNKIKVEAKLQKQPTDASHNATPRGITMTSSGLLPRVAKAPPEPFLLSNKKVLVSVLLIQLVITALCQLKLLSSSLVPNSDT